VVSANAFPRVVLIASDIEGPDAVSKHYSLLAAIMRVICAALLSRGAQNEQSLEQGRRFITENRLSILAVLKKSAGLVAGVVVSEQIEDLAESFMLLLTFTGFLEVSVLHQNIGSHSNLVTVRRKSYSQKVIVDGVYVRCGRDRIMYHRY
jgi:hypothetical protein